MQDLEATFAGYRLHEAISHDAVSTVYRATTSSWDAARPGGARTVALLVSEPLTSETDRRQARVFERRAAAAMDIHHPGVARVLDVGATGNRVYMATAWRDSVTLDEVLSRAWQLSPEDAVDLLHLLAEGLDVAHDAGLVHGALTNRTIRVDSGEDRGRRDAFVTGFGVDTLLARRLGSKRQRDSGPVLDDLLYVAPEQLRGDMLDPATDQYALACTLYHCVSGQPPFVRDTASALFGAHLFARPPVAGALAEHSGHALRDALATGLAKHPRERHGSCTQLLRAALDGRESTAAVPPGVGPPPAAGVAATNGVGGRMTTGVATTGATVSRARNGLARRARSSRRTLGDALRNPQTPVLAVAALVTGAVLAALIAMLLRSADPTPAARADAQDASAVVAEQPPPRAAAEPEPAPEPETPPGAEIAWDRAVTGTAVSSVTARSRAVIVAAEGEVVALDPDSGEARWQRAVDDGAVTGTVTTDKSYVYRSSQLYAVALADGRQRWSRDDLYTPTGSLTAVPGGLLYGMGPGLNMPELAAIDPDTGEELWHFHHAGDVHTKMNAGVAADDDLVAILQRGSLFGIDPNGGLITTSLGRQEIASGSWRIDIARPWTASVSLLADGVLVATRDGDVCSHARRDGEQRWCQQVAGGADRRPSLLPSDDAVVVATRTAVVALDPATGATQWEVPAPAPISVAARHDGTIVTGDTAGRLRAFAVASGEQEWETTGAAAITSLTMNAEGVYAGTREGTVLRVQPPQG